MSFIVMLQQAGSTTLRKITYQEKDKIPESPSPLSAVVVRHPFERLASAYRLKFLSVIYLLNYCHQLFIYCNTLILSPSG